MAKFSDIISVIKNKSIVGKTYFIVWLFILLVIINFVTFPVYRFGGNGMFYLIDPDVVYVANALSNIKHGVINYFDHPGIVSISFLSYAYMPFRVLAKFLLQVPFSQFAYEYLDIIFYYSRLLQNLIFISAISVFYWTLIRATKSLAKAVLGIILLFSFQPVYFSASSISAEPLTLLISSFWIFIAFRYIKTKSILQIYLLLFTSGFLMANRSTAFFYILLSLGLLALHQTKPILIICKRLVFGSCMAIVGLFLGLTPVIGNLMQILHRMVFFAASSGVHGSGVLGIVDVKAYIESISVFIHRDIGLVSVASLFVILAILNIKSQNSKVRLIGLVSLTGILIFAKFPLAHYQLPNYLLLVFSFILSLPKNNFYTYILIAFFVFVMQQNFVAYKNQINSLLVEENNVENFIDEHKNEVPSIYSWGRSENFAKMWIRDWGGVFEDELAKSNTYEIKGDLSGIKIGSNKESDFITFCWRSAYVQKDSLDKVLANMEFKVKIVPIPGSENLFYLTRLKCLE